MYKISAGFIDDEIISNSIALRLVEKKHDQYVCLKSLINNLFLIFHLIIENWKGWSINFNNVAEIVFDCTWGIKTTAIAFANFIKLPEGWLFISAWFIGRIYFPILLFELSYFANNPVKIL